MDQLTFENKIVKGYSFKQLIGEGGFGRVFLALQLESGDFFAIKVIELERFQEYDGIVGELVQAEIDGMKKVQSIHVIRYIDSFQDNFFSYLVMEYCDSGDLEAQLRDAKLKLTELDAIGIIKQILQGLKHMHEKFIIHRDLKMANILIHKKSVYKIADLGFCKLLDNATGQADLKLGSEHTMAPEINNEQPYGLLSDLYSVGVILYYILYKRYPYQRNSQDSNFPGKLNFPINSQIKVSDATKDLLTRMLEVDPKKRITFAEISTHKAFEKSPFSFISRVQIQSNQIDLSSNEQFYKDKSQNLNEQIQIQEDQRMQTRLKTKTRLSGQLQIQQPKDQNMIGVSGKILLGLQNQSFIEKSKKKSLLDKKISSISQQINRVYYFSNTVTEIVEIQLKIHLIFALLCHNIQFMNNQIVAQIMQEIKENESDNDVKEDVQDLHSQLQETLFLQDTIKYQLEDIELQLRQSGEKLIDNLKQQSQGGNKNQFSYELCKNINQYLAAPIDLCTVVYHIIQCGKYSLGIKSEVENVQIEQYFDLKQSKQLVFNQEAIKLEFKQLVENIQY